MSNIVTQEGPKEAPEESDAKWPNVGDKVAPLVLRDIRGSLVRIPDDRRLVHLQFRRYAGCPVCNLHIRSFVRRNDEIVTAGVQEIVVFYSDAKTMLEFQGQLPFPAIADPDKELYAKFGANRRISVLRALDFRSWFAAFNALVKADSLHGAMGNGEDKMGLPSEFLIGKDGRVLASKRGNLMNDHWSVDEVLELARRGSEWKGPQRGSSRADS